MLTVGNIYCTVVVLSINKLFAFKTRITVSTILKMGNILPIGGSLS